MKSFSPLKEQIATCRAASNGKAPEEQLTGYVEALVSFLLGLPHGLRGATIAPVAR